MYFNVYIYFIVIFFITDYMYMDSNSGVTSHGSITIEIARQTKIKEITNTLMQIKAAKYFDVDQRETELQYN